MKKILIVDARSYASAVTNRARGGGCEYAEYYPCPSSHCFLVRIFVVIFYWFFKKQRYHRIGLFRENVCYYQRFIRLNRVQKLLANVLSRLWLLVKISEHCSCQTAQLSVVCYNCCHKFEYLKEITANEHVIAVFLFNDFIWLLCLK